MRGNRSIGRADNTRLRKIRIVIRCTGFRAFDIFRSIWSGNLNVQFEIRSATQRPCYTAERERGGRGGEGQTVIKKAMRKLAKVDDANRRMDTMESATGRFFA